MCVSVIQLAIYVLQFLYSSVNRHAGCFQTLAIVIIKHMEAESRVVVARAEEVRKMGKGVGVG